MFVVDGGETALLEGLRVAPWERGRGIAGVLQRFGCQLVKHRYPSVKVMRLTRDDKLTPKELNKYKVISKQVKLHGTTEENCGGTGHSIIPALF